VFRVGAPGLSRDLEDVRDIVLAATGADVTGEYALVLVAGDSPDTH
jgi:hypothetical protein